MRPRNAVSTEGKAIKKKSDKYLLEGPQISHNAINQDDVDALLANFD